MRRTIHPLLHLTLREKARIKQRQDLEEQKGTGWWLNEREIQFDDSYRLAKENRNNLEAISKTCDIANREDSRRKLETIIANMLRFGDRRPVVVALATKQKKLTPIIHKLFDHKLLDFKIGNNMENPRYSRIWPTKKLLDNFEAVLTSGIVVDPPNLIEVRDDNGNTINYKDTDRTRHIRNILKKANNINESAEIKYGAYPVSTALIAIFKRNLNLYGRLHTKGCYQYQGLKEKERAEITIKDEPIVELDYSGLHPHLLYAMEGKQLNKDPYTIVVDNEELRPFLKKCLLIILNATSCRVDGNWIKETSKRKAYYRKAYVRSAEANAMSSINQHIDDYVDKKSEEEIKTRPQRMKYFLRRKALLKENNITTARQIIDRFREALPEISHHFFSDNDTGLKTMNKDASIALDVVEHFSKQGIPILAIHDSFIVQERYKDELNQTMDRVYKKHTGGFSCPVD